MIILFYFISDGKWVQLKIMHDTLVYSLIKSLLFNFCEQKFVQHGPVTIAIDSNGFSLLIFEAKWPNYASGSKSAPNSDSFWVRRLFTRQDHNELHLIFFFAKIGIFCKSIAGRLNEALFKPIDNHIRSAEG